MGFQKFGGPRLWGVWASRLTQSKAQWGANREERACLNEKNGGLGRTEASPANATQRSQKPSADGSEAAVLAMLDESSAARCVCVLWR